MASIKKKRTGPPCILTAKKFSDNSNVNLRSIRSLGVFCFSGEDQAIANVHRPPKDVRIHNPHAIERWVMVHLPSSDPESLPALAEISDIDFPYTAKIPDSAAWNAMIEIGRMRKSAPVPGMPSNQPPPAKHTLESIRVPDAWLDPWGFPTTGCKLDSIKGANEGFVIDCEMCLVGTKKVPTRLAIVRFSDGEVLFNELIKPEETITDYVTAFSGITHEMLQDVTFSLKDAQDWMKQHIGRSDFIIGHSVDNDLRVLQVQHDRVIDTTLLFQHVRGYPYKSSLRYLAKKHLGWEIQLDSKNGHDPVEDAVACEKLVRLILEKGPEIGDNRSHTMPLSTFLAQRGFKSAIVSPTIPDWDYNGSASHLLETDASKCVDQTLKALKSNHFVACTLLPSANTDLNAELLRLKRDLPSHTLMTTAVNTENKYLAEIERLTSKKALINREDQNPETDAATKTVWTEEDQAALKDAKTQLARGHAYFAISIKEDEIQQLKQNSVLASKLNKKQAVDRSEASE